MFFEVKNFQALRKAMEELSEYLEESDVPEEEVFDSKLGGSELVGNVLRHSDGVASLEGEVRGNFIEIKVRSSVCFCPPEKSCCPDVMAEGGRGLFIVDSVCTERSFTEDGGIRVRIEIAGRASIPDDEEEK